MGVEVLQNPGYSTNQHRERVEDAVRDLLARDNLKAILALSGGSEDGSEEMIVNILKDLILNVKDFPVAILTGGTEGGIPEIGIRVAREFSVPTIGVFPPRARRYALFDYLDLAIETLPPSVGNASFGTETPSFVNLANGIAVVGGSFGTLTEIATALKVNAGRIKNGETPIYICPIQGTGGVADIISSLPGIEKVRLSLPERSITTGAEAASFFRDRLVR